MSKHKIILRMSKAELLLAQRIKAWNEAQECMIPTIKRNKLDPAHALGLLIMHANEHLMNTPVMDEERMRGMIESLLVAWKEGRFVARPDYPYSLQETLDFARNLANEKGHS